MEQMAAALKRGREHRWWPWVALAVSTGLRPGEQAALAQKRLGQHAALSKASVQHAESAFIFSDTRGRPWHYREISEGIQRFCAATGLQRITAHQLRHYHASLLIQQGLPLTLVARRLGHASPEITARVYAHWLGEDDSPAAEAVSRALR